MPLYACVNHCVICVVNIMQAVGRSGLVGHWVMKPIKHSHEKGRGPDEYPALWKWTDGSYDYNRCCISCLSLNVECIIFYN